MVDFKKIVYEWWMGTTQAQSDKNWMRFGAIIVWPWVLGQSGKYSFIIWVIIRGALTYGFWSCSHNAICVQAYARDEREPYSSRSWRFGSDLELLQAVYDVFTKLDLTIESLGQFGNEVNKKLLFLSIKQ